MSVFEDSWAGTEDFEVDESDSSMQRVYEDLQITDKMTICIAAIAREGDKEYAVIAADECVQDYGLNLNFDGYRKFRFFNDEKCAVMLAGNLNLFNDFVIDLPISGEYSDYKKRIFDNYVSVKNVKREEYFKLNPNRLNNNYVLNASIILAGVNEVGKIGITTIIDKGSYDYADFGFCCIGIGSTVAANSLNYSRQPSSCSLKETVYNVYKAKRFSEVVQGVGKETDMVVFSKGSYKELGKKDFDVLEKVFKEELEYGKSHKDLGKITF